MLLPQRRDWILAFLCTIAFISLVRADTDNVTPATDLITVDVLSNGLVNMERAVAGNFTRGLDGLGACTHYDAGSMFVTGQEGSVYEVLTESSCQVDIKPNFVLPETIEKFHVELKTAGQLFPSAVLNWSPKSLKSLKIIDSAMTGPLPDLSKFKHLEELDLSGNNFNSTLPDSICKLSNLRVLCLQSNKLRGTLPSCLSKMKNLEKIYLSQNMFSGEIPNSIGKLSKLYFLGLGGNMLTGTITPTIGKLKKLEFIDLSGNRMKGTIPEAVCYLPNLETLSLRGDFAANPPLPKTFEIGREVEEEMSEMVRENQQVNSFDGTIPKCFTQLEKLKHLDLRYLQLEGPIKYLAQMPVLTHLQINGNNFNGPLPTAWSSASSLYVLNLSDNYFTGAIPDYRHLKQLYDFDVSYNLLVGSIPTFFVGSKTIQKFDVGSNDLKGTVPVALMKKFHTKLQHFALAGNEQIRCYLPGTRKVPNYAKFAESNDFQSFKMLCESGGPIQLLKELVTSLKRGDSADKRCLQNLRDIVGSKHRSLKGHLCMNEFMRKNHDDSKYIESWFDRRKLRKFFDVCKNKYLKE
eukprot:13535_1